jgi:hypothetical protein
MQKVRLFVIVFVVAATSFGMPSQVFAAPSIPSALTAVRTVVSQVDPGQSKTISVRMPWRANMIGVSFIDPSHSQNGVAIVTRAHTAAGWSSWEELGENDNGTTGVEARHETTRVTTEALWVGTADRVEVRLSVGTGVKAIHDVRVHLINTLGDARPANVFTRVIHAIGHFFSLHAVSATTPAQAATSQPAIISRAQWGADASHLNLPCPGIAPTLNMAFIHHTDTTNSYTKSQSAGIVRGIFRYHTDTRGYCDIAYNFLVDKYGQIFEGRLGGITNNVVGAHTGGYNYGSVGVAMLGNYSNVKPTSAMLTSVTKLLAWRLDVAHVPAIGTVSVKTGSGNDHHAAGSMVTFNRIAGHRDASYTSCPGAYLYRDMAWIRSKVASIGVPKIYLPLQSSLILRPDGDGKNDSSQVTASLNNTARWKLVFTNATGTALRTFSALTYKVSATWDGKNQQGQFVPNGIYRWTLTAVDSTGHSATPASGQVSVITDHPAGTLLSDSTGKYALTDGTLHLVDPTAYASTYGTLPAVATGPGERSRYAIGSPLALRSGTLLVGPTGIHYIWSGGALRAFSTDPTNTFTALGYPAAAAIPASQAYIDALPAGTDVTSVSTHPDGTALKSVDGKTFYVVDAGTLRRASALARASWYRWNEVVTVTAGDLVLPAGAAFPVRDGTLIKATDGGAPWIVSDGTKHRFVSTTFATLMGYTTSMMLTATAADINAIPTGARVG